MLKIIITGPESSGKTTLCKQLSKHFKVPFINEYARDYIDNLDRDYDKEDLLKIAKEQLSLEQANESFLFCDTDLITIKVWSLFKYKVCDNWIIDQIEKQKSENRFYILCKPDIPWVYDSQRENPNDREDIFEIYKTKLEELGRNYFVVKGKDRFQQSISKISFLINNI